MVETRGDRRWRPGGLKGSVQENPVARITILGAGFMGSALTFPASDNGHQVTLWGTWLDDHLIEAVRRGEPHPKLRLRLPPGVRVCDHTQLAEALAGADLVVNAVTSEGTLPVLTQALPHLTPGTPLMSVSKGLLRWAVFGSRGRARA